MTNKNDVLVTQPHKHTDTVLQRRRRDAYSACQMWFNVHIKVNNNNSIGMRAYWYYMVYNYNNTNK